MRTACGPSLAAILIGCLCAAAPGSARAQSASTPACRVAQLEEERSMLAAARRSLAQLEELGAALRSQADEAEARLRNPGAPPALAERYRQLRSQLRDVEAQRTEFSRLLAGWCEPSGPQR